jgi:hypothetical protein
VPAQHQAPPFEPGASESPAPETHAEPVAAEPRAAGPEPSPAARTDDGEQPTHVMRPVDEDGADTAADPDTAAGAEAVAQPTGERREP